MAEPFDHSGGPKEEVRAEIAAVPVSLSPVSYPNPIPFVRESLSRPDLLDPD